MWAPKHKSIYEKKSLVFTMHINIFDFICLYFIYNLNDTVLLSYIKKLRIRAKKSDAS